MNRLYRILCSLCFAMIFGLWLSPTAVAQTSGNSALDAEAYLSQAIEHIQHQHYSQALPALNQAIKLDKTLAEAYNDRCYVSINIGDYSHAIKDCLQAIKLEPSRTNTYLHLGIAYYRNGDLSDAIAAYDYLLEHQPTAALGYYNRGLAYAQLQQYSQAIADYDQALYQTQSLELPELANIYIDRGVAYLMNNQISDAVANFSAAIHCDTNNPRAHYNLGCACHRQGKTQVALHEFTTTLDLNPDHALAYFNRAMIRQQQGLYAGAIADLEAACQCFTKQGNQTASQHTLALMKQLQQWLHSNDFQIIA
ncbi:MAG: tetratricopeptide repeat protein [Cyanobacteriota bacterium]|nr:tetratricopeptide repeat protein [Cyanobacteriota bacterium]